MNTDPQIPHDQKNQKDQNTHDTTNDQDSIFGYEIPAPLRAAIKMLRSVFNNSANLHAQFERWLPVLTALRQLGHTSQKLGQHYFRYFTYDADHEPNAPKDSKDSRDSKDSKDSNHTQKHPNDPHTTNHQKTKAPSPLPLELLTELQAGFTDLTQTFPDVASFFLDTDKIDKFLADILLDPANALPGHRLFKLINEQSTRAIGKFVELTILSASKDAPSAESTHAFLKRAEHLLDSIVQRWIWPIVDPTHSANPPNEQTP